MRCLSRKSSFQQKTLSRGDKTRTQEGFEEFTKCSDLICSILLLILENFGDKKRFFIAGQLKFETSENITITLEEDGTEIDEEYYISIRDDTSLMLLEEGETWTGNKAIPISL